eukprot:1959710-Rhodomonas_salina.1
MRHSQADKDSTLTTRCKLVVVDEIPSLENSAGAPETTKSRDVRRRPMVKCKWNLVVNRRVRKVIVNICPVMRSGTPKLRREMRLQQ